MSAADVAVVRNFLYALAEPDLDVALGLLAPDVEWRNTGVPTFRGRRVHAMMRDMVKRRIGFGVEIHAIASDGERVLTDRTDALALGKVRTEFRVCGTFEVRDGQITLWDDHFAMGGLLGGFVKGTRKALRGR